jgi:hypothetical protein
MSKGPQSPHKRPPGESGGEGRAVRDEAGELPEEMAGLLGALADGRGEISDEDFARLEAELGAAAMREELASHRALVTELRAMPSRAPSPNWGALEASIKLACDEVGEPRWWSRAGLRQLWRWPTLGMGAAAMASLALLLWQRAPKPVEEVTTHRDAGHEVQPSPKLGSPQPVPAPQLGITLDDEDLLDTDIDDGAVGELIAQLPPEVAATLDAQAAPARLAPDEDEDEDDLFGGSFDEVLEQEIDQLDAEALRALDQWLETEQKE